MKTTDSPTVEWVQELADRLDGIQSIAHRLWDERARSWAGVAETARLTEAERKLADHYDSILNLVATTEDHEQRLKALALALERRQATGPDSFQGRLDRLFSSMVEHEQRLRVLENGGKPLAWVENAIQQPSRVASASAPLPGPDIATPADWRQVREDAEYLLACSYSLATKHDHFPTRLRRILETAQKFEGGR